MMKPLVAALCLVGVGAVSGDQDLGRINRALGHWLELIDADYPYLLVDRQAGELRLQHGRAVLRVCPVVEDDLGAAPKLRTKVDLHLRRYRLSGPLAVRPVGVFDWEQNLVEQASPESALYCTSGLLLYGAAVWEPVAGPKLRLQVEDIQALYNACAASTPVVILPPQWKEE